MLLIGAGIFVTAGDLVLARWAMNGSGLWLGLALNLVGIMFYAQTLRLESVGVATALFLGVNIAAVALGGYVVFGDALTRNSMLGIGLMVLSIVLMEV